MTSQNLRCFEGIMYALRGYDSPSAHYGGPTGFKKFKARACLSWLSHGDNSSIGLYYTCTVLLFRLSKAIIPQYKTTLRSRSATALPHKR
jgi:hypothetical protein